MLCYKEERALGLNVFPPKTTDENEFLIKPCYAIFWIGLFGEFDTFVMCHLFVRFRLISIARYVFKSPSICFRGTKKEIYREHVAYCILYCDAVPGFLI